MDGYMDAMAIQARYGYEWDYAPLFDPLPLFGLNGPHVVGDEEAKHTASVLVPTAIQISGGLLQGFCKEVGCTGQTTVAANNTGPGGGNPDENFDVSSRLIELEELDITKQAWKDLYGRTGIKKGYNELFLGKLGLEVYAEIAAITDEAEFNAAVNKYTPLFDNIQKEAKHSFEDTYYASADVAFLSDAFVDNAAELLLKRLKEPIREVKETFTPAALLKNQPVLLIPSGALTGFNDSPMLKASLDEYVKTGGTLIVLSQKHGYDYASIPTPDGKPITGYGWEEDQNCFADSVAIESWHQMLSGQSRSTPTLNVDGYFTGYPANSTILLRRTANGQPALLMYEHGLGRVIVTSMYSDWAYGHGQASQEEIALIRDMLSWAKNPAQLPEIKPRETVSLPVTLTNSTATDAASIKLQIWNPDRSTLLSEQTISVSIPAGQSAINNVSWQAPSNAVLGIYHVDYLLFDATGTIIQPQAETDSGRFVVSSPPQTGTVKKDIWLSITSPNQEVFFNEPFLYTFHIYNNTATTRNLTLKTFLPHTGRTHEWPVTAAANGETVISGTDLFIDSNYMFETLRAYLYDENNVQIGSYMLSFKGVYPQASVTTAPGKPLYTRGETVALNVGLGNSRDMATTVKLKVVVTDPANSSVFSSTAELLLPASGSDSRSFSFPLQQAAQGGVYAVSAEVLDLNGVKIGGDSASFELPLSQIAVTPLLPAAIATGPNPFFFTLQNNSKQAVSAGSLSVELKSPEGTTISATSQPFTLDGGQSSTIAVPLSFPSVKFGNYTLAYSQSDETKTGKPVIIPLADNIIMEPVLDKPAYRVRESANLDLNLINNGKFNLDNVAVTVATADLAYSGSQTIALASANRALYRFALPIPDSATPGQHLVTMTAALPSGSSITKSLTITIPESSLTIGTPAASHTAGESVKLPLLNSGGVDTSADYTIELYDSWYKKILSNSAQTSVNAGATGYMELATPPELVSGRYYLSSSFTDRKKSKTLYDLKEISVKGVETEVKTVTSKDWYVPTEIVSASTSLVMKSGELPDGSLNLKVLASYADSSLSGLKWWDSRWKYRQPLVINVGNTARENYPASVDFNFTDEFSKSGKSGTFDENSLRVIEYDADGNVLGEIPSQLDKAGDYNAASNAKGSVYWIMNGTTPAGSVRRYAIYFDTVENGQKAAAAYPLVQSTLDNAKSFWKTDGVYIKWGGNGYNIYSPEIITDFRFDDNGNGDPTDDFDRIQDSLAYGDWWFGFLGGGHVSGFGSSTGSIVKQGPVFTELTLGVAKFRYYRNNKQWVEANGSVNYLFNFNALYDYVKAGNMAEYSIIREQGWETYYSSNVQPGYLAYRSSTKNVIFGAIATNVDMYNCRNKSSSGYDRGLSFAINANNSTAKIYWYSDTSGNYQNIGKLSDSVINPPAFINAATEIQTGDTSSAVVWQTTVPVNLAQSATVSTPIDFTGRSAGKYYLQSTLTSGLKQVIAQESHPFYFVTGNTLLIASTEKQVYHPKETVVIVGELRNLGADETPNVILSLKAKTAGGTTQELLNETLTIPAGRSHPFTMTTIAGAEGTFYMTGDVTLNGEVLAKIADQYEVASPKVTASLTAPDIAANNPFVIGLELKNSGKVEAAIAIGKSFDSQPETVTIPAGQTKLFQYSQQISADTIDTFTLSGDHSQTLSKAVRYGSAASLAVSAEALYPEGKVTLPLTVANSGLIDSQFSVNYQLNQGASSINSQTKSYFLAKGTSSSDNLIFDLSEGSYQFAATSQKPAANAAASFQVRKETKANLTLSIGAQSNSLFPATINVTNLGYLPIEGSVRLSLIGANGTSTWSAAQDANLPQTLNPEPRTMLFNINLATLKPGSYTVKAELLDGGNRQLASQSAPFTLLGPTIAITQLPPYRTIPSGGSSDFTFKVRNSGSQEGKFELQFKADDLIDAVRSEWLKPGEEKEITFALQVAGDLDEKDYIASWRLKTAGAIVTEGVTTYRLAGLKLAVTASLDRSSYTPGDTATLTLTVTQQDSGAAPNLFARANYNGYNEKQTFKLNSSQILVFNVPLTQITGEKLFYGIYTESGRSIHLNTIYLRKADAGLALATDKQVYNPGETVMATISGTATGDLTLTGPGEFSTTFAYSGSDSKSFALPATMTAGTYMLNAQLKTQNSQLITASYPFDVTGIQVKVKEALLDKTKYAATDSLQLKLTIESNRDLAATVRTWIVDPAGNYTPAGESAVALTSATPILTTQNSTLTTASLGIHKLVYGIYQGELLLASGAKAFDIGEAVLLALATDRSDYPEVTTPVTVKADLYGTTAAGIELLLDGQSINSDSITLSGQGSYTFAIPPASVTPGIHTLKAVLSSAGLTSSRETRFTFGSSLPDLTARVVANSPVGGTLTLMLTVNNQGKTSAMASSATLYDGNPANGGQLLAILNVPSIPAGSLATLSYEWNILGRSGDHVIYSKVDSDNIIAEFIEGNNSALTAVSLPSYSMAIAVGKDSYGANEAAAITINLANLSASLPLESSTLKLRLTSATGLTTDLPDRSMGTIAPATVTPLSEIWSSGISAPSIYTVTARLVSGTNELASATTSFAIVATTSLTGSIAPTVAEIPQEGALEALYTISNSGNVAVDGRLQVIIKDPGSGITKALQEITLQLPVSGSKTGTFTLQINGLEIKGYDLLLGFIATAADISVARSQFTIKDTILPVLTVSTLSNGSYTNQETLNVSGTVQDNSGSAQVEINGAIVPVTVDGSFSQALLLKNPENTVEVKAIDMAGNKVVDNRIIHFDQNAPTLTIDSPTDNSKTAISPIEVKGSVDKTSTVTVKLNGIIQPVVMDANRFSASITPEPRWNTIEITASDLAGNTSSQKRSVLFDDQKPSLSITEPDQDIRTNKSSMTISGKAADPYSSVGVTVAIDGVLLTPLVVNDIFSQIVTFTDEKLYPITITASNKVGTQTIAQRNIIFDKTPPNLTINPVSSPTNVAIQTVSGTREDGRIVTASCATATVSAVEYPTTTTWRAAISGLAQGENRLRVETTDLAGNRTTATATILYVPKAPEVTISASPNQIWPPNKKLVPITISGSVATFGSDIKDVTISVADEYGKYNLQGVKFGDTLLLEAWREGNDMDGRLYTITAVVTDQAGNRTTRSTTVIVPHDMGK